MMIYDVFFNFFRDHFRMNQEPWCTKARGGPGGAAPPQRPEALAGGVRGGGAPLAKTINLIFYNES